MIFGVLKPIGPTSFAVVAKVRRLSGVKKVGHAGTLDPLASGVLVVAVGRESTKQIDTLMLTQKEYQAEIRLGQTSTTDDSEGEKTLVEFASIPHRAQVEQVVAGFVGTIEQTPPLFSAIKVAGKPAYDYMRHGKTVTLNPRSVTIDDIEILVYEWPVLTIRVVCQKGVYIRSLARDIGERLGVGGYIAKLDRTRVGEYTYANSVPMEKLYTLFPDSIKKT